MTIDSLQSLRDDFDRVFFISEAVRKRIQLAGADILSNDAGKHVTETEHAILRMTQFFCLVSNNGRLYPHLELGLELLPFLEQMDLSGTVAALHALCGFADKHNCAIGSIEFESKVEPVHEQLEAPAEGDFLWATRIMQYVAANPEKVPVVSA